MSAASGDDESASSEGEEEPELTMADVKKALDQRGHGEGDEDKDDLEDDDEDEDEDEDYDRKVENPNFKFDPYRDVEEEKEPEEVMCGMFWHWR